ncbi:MAG: FAD-dependent oxidoreductase [Chloroflexota bacterium]
MDQYTNNSEIAVVGGGLAGLAAATYLARAGRTVTLFEKSAGTGGRAVSVCHDGFSFNMGAHALYKGSPAMQVLEELGISFTGGSPGLYKAAENGNLHLLPAGPLSLLRTGLLSPGDKLQLARILASLQSMKPSRWQQVSLRDWLNGQTTSKDVRRLVEAVARTTTYTYAPDQLSLGFLIEQLRLVLKGVVYVDGGWQTLVGGLSHAARNVGVHIRTGERVEAVTHAARSVTGVRLADGTHHAAGAVVVAAAPRDLSRLVDEGQNCTLKEWATRSVPVKAACLDVALRRLPQPDNKIVVSVDRPLFLTTQSPYSRVAPDGQALVYTLRYLSPGENPDPQTIEHELESWLDTCQQGWRDELVHRRYLPNMVVSNAIVTAAAGGTAARPGPEVPGIAGLYAAGDWVGPVGNLASATLWSAKLAANLILTTTRHEAREAA